jgi:glycosyltransferase involved in cell wall biosynthesis
MAKFSIIMQSFLGDYPGAATNREEKSIRAIASVIEQTFEDWELTIIADGCERTFEAVSELYLNDDRISCYLIPKQQLWSGTARDLGKIQSKGDYCLYLDTDDLYSKHHLEIINDSIGSLDWVWYNDFVWNGKAWIERKCNIRRIGFNGTSNVCFKRKLDVNWSTFTGYAHDFYFNQQLLKVSAKFAHIKTPGYYVCHLPKHPGGAGYDI